MDTCMRFSDVNLARRDLFIASAIQYTYYDYIQSYQTVFNSGHKYFYR